MLMLALMQFAWHVQKAYTFTNHKRPFTYPYSAMVQATSVYKPIQNLFFLPELRIEPGNTFVQILIIS